MGLISRRRTNIIKTVAIGVIIWMTVLAIISMNTTHNGDDEVKAQFFQAAFKQPQPDLSNVNWEEDQLKLEPIVPNEDAVNVSPWQNFKVTTSSVSTSNIHETTTSKREEIVLNNNENGQVLALPQQTSLKWQELGMLADPDDNIFIDQNPGDMGKAFVLPKHLKPELKKLVDEGYKRNAFNQYISDIIGLHRRLEDMRDDWCKAQTYHQNLPNTSVVIIFHNEAFSALARTAHSVLDRTPPELLEEIVLVDDASTFVHLKQPLDEYFAQFPKVKIIRAPERGGLIKARILGFQHSKGAVVTFLDSHCEVTDGWLEPLLDRIAQDPTTVVCPVIPVIGDDNLRFVKEKNSVQVGGFDWSLTFTWHYLPKSERERHKSPFEPVYSPTMAGGLFAIDRNWFTKLGMYDPGFDIWGGENLEISFKIWMCGGKLEYVPCSLVGHIFRKRSPYKWRDGVNVVSALTNIIQP